MATTFPNIDFKFRRGTKDGYSTTSYLEGSLNFVKDDEALYVHKDGISFRISDVVLDAGTEDQIRGIALPKAKLYYASDSHKIMWFDKEHLEWVYIESTKADNATKALKDDNGNIINEYYYPRSEAQADYTTLDDKISAVIDDIGHIVEFKTIVCSSISDLPEVGEKNTIYLVPKTSYYDWDILPPGEEKDAHVELLFIESEEYGNFYELIGSTVIHMDNYYTKDEVDALLNTLQQSMLTEYNTFKTDMLAEMNGFRSTMNSLIATVNTNIAAISAQVTTMANNIANHEGRIVSLESRVTTIEQELDGGGSGGEGSIAERITALETGLSDLDDEYTANKTATDQTITNNYNTLNTSISTVNTNVNSLITRVTNDEATISNHTTRLNTAESTLSNHGSRITALENTVIDMSGYGQRITTLEGHDVTHSADIANLKTRVNIIENDFALAEQGLEGPQVITAVEDRTDETSTISDILTRVDTLEELYGEEYDPEGDPDNPIYSLYGRMSTAENKISILENEESGGSAGLAALTSRVSTAESKISSLESSDTTQTSNIATLNGKVSNLESSDATQTSNISSLTTRMDTAENDITGVAGRVTTAEGNISNVTTRMSSAEGNITSLQNNDSTQNTNISGLTTRMGTAESNITGVTGRVSTLESSDTTQNTNISNIDGRVTTIEGTFAIAEQGDEADED